MRHPEPWVEIKLTRNVLPSAVVLASRRLSIGGLAILPRALELVFDKFGGRESGALKFENTGGRAKRRRE
jgi:hypothetical protein